MSRRLTDIERGERIAALRIARRAERFSILPDAVKRGWIAYVTGKETPTDAEGIAGWIVADHEGWAQKPEMP